MQIERGTYFTLYAPRQMGKTTLMRDLAQELLKKPDYLPIILSFENFESLPATDFIDSFWSELSLSLINSLKSRSLLEPSIEKWLTAQTPNHFVALQKLLETLHLKIPPIRIT